MKRDRDLRDPATVPLMHWRDQPGQNDPPGLSTSTPTVPATVPSGIALRTEAGRPQRVVTGPPTGPWPLPGVGLNAPRRRRRPRPAVLAVVASLAVAAVAAAGIGLGGVLDRLAALRAGADAQAGIEQLLDRIDAALRSGNGPALAALADPADSALRTRWGGLPERADSVGASGLSLRGITAADGTGAVLLPGPSRPGYLRTLQVPVRLGYTLAPWDAASVATRLTLQVGLRGRTWWLVDDVAADRAQALGTTAGIRPAPIEPWVRGAVDVVRRPHALVVGDPSRRVQNAALADTLEAAVIDVQDVVSSPTWTGRVVAYATTDQQVLASWFAEHGGIGARDPAVGEAVGEAVGGTVSETVTEAVAETGHGAGGPAAFAAEVRTLAGSDAAGSPAAARLAVTPLLLDRAGADLDRTAAVLRHETTHVALALDGEREPPTWLVEGIAEYTAYHRVRSGRVDDVAALDQRGLSGTTWRALAEGRWRPGLVADPDQFYGGSAAEVAQAYTDAWLTCLYIAAEYGEATLFELYRTAAARPADEGSGVVEQVALREVLGLDRSGLARGTADYAAALRARFS